MANKKNERKKALKVGFDLDGVILYNPARISRPIIALIKKVFLKKRKGVFYVPKSAWEKQLWRLFHKTSIFVAPGIENIEKLVKEEKIEAYLITARYSFLKNDLDQWLNKINAHKIFKKCYYNLADEQPHLFKEKMIKKLNLDIFVEDNWNIVQYLNSVFPIKPTVLWIYNLFDKRINYLHGCSSLKNSINVISQITSPQKTKCLILSDYFYPHWTGIAKSIFNLVNALEHQIDFTVLTTRFKKDIPLRQKLKSVQIIRTPYFLSFSRVKLSYEAVKIFYKIVRDFDTVFVNSPYSNIFPISLITRLFNKRLIIFHQGDLILPRGKKNRLIEILFDICTLIGCFFADKIVTYTDDYSRHSRILKHFLFKFQAIIPPLFITPPASKIDSKLSKLVTQKKLLYGFAGRFVEEKGFDTLLKAIPRVIEKNPQVHFVFAGSTKIGYENFYQKNLPLIRKLSSHLTILDLLNGDQLSAFYHTLHYLIIPSRSDCFALVQQEAILANTPIIVSDIPGARMLVQKTGFGYIFNVNDWQRLAAVILASVKTRNSLENKHQLTLKILDNSKNAEAFKRLIEGRN